MKSIFILFDPDSNYEKLPLFNQENAFDITNKRVFEIIKSVNNNADYKEKFTFVKNEALIIKSPKNLLEGINTLISSAESNKSDTIVFSYADCPFINLALTEELLTAHYNYKAEYTFADGYSYGFSPEIIDLGALKILSELLKSTYENEGKMPITRDFLFEIIKKDINSFEVETVLAEDDWRLLRYEFHCGKKENYFACKALFSKVGQEYLNLSAEELCNIAKDEVSILKTLPAFYNIQIAEKCPGLCKYCPYPSSYKAKYNLSPCDSKKEMSLEKFSQIIDKIAAFSGEAVIGLSPWGEPLNNSQIIPIIEKVLSYSGLSVFMETDASKVDEKFCSDLKALLEGASERSNNWPKIMIAVSFDSFTSTTYEKLRANPQFFEQAMNAVKLLSNVIPGNVYPQFVRQNENEEELENFFRYWSEKTNPSSGQLIIQKYNDFCKELEDAKPADLSPLERNVCWHLRRDMTILINGDVPLCYNHIFDNIKGNVFESSLEEIWEKFNDEICKHIEKNYCEKCGKCDEYYTFNF